MKRYELKLCDCELPGVHNKKKKYVNMFTSSVKWKYYFLKRIKADWQEIPYVRFLMEGAIV